MFLPMVLFASAILAVPGDQPPMDILEAIATAHQANRTLFTKATMRLRYSVGNAPDADSALQGRWTSRSDAGGRFVMDGAWMRYEQAFDPEVMRAELTVNGPGRYSTRLFSVRLVTDGRVTLTDRLSIPANDPARSAPVNEVRVDPGDIWFFQHAHVPLAPGPSGVATLFGNAVQLLKGGDEGLRLKEVRLDSRLDGVEVAEVVVETPNTVWRFWIDLKRGAVPVQERIEFAGNGIFQQTRCLDLRQVSSGAWIPFRVAQFTNNGNAAHDLTILDADFEKPPTPAEFRLEFATPQPAFDMANMREYPPSKVWDLARLPAATAPGVQPIGRFEDSVQPPTMPDERQPVSYVPMVAVLAGVVLVACSVILYRRRSRA